MCAIYRTLSYAFVNNNAIGYIDALGFKTLRPYSRMAILSDLESGMDLNRALDRYDKRPEIEKNDCNMPSYWEEYFKSLVGINDFNKNLEFISNNPYDPTWIDYYDAVNLTWNPTLGMFEAIGGTSYSAGKWGQNLETGERVLRGAVSLAASTATGYGIKNISKMAINKIFNPDVNVTSWAAKGLTPDLNSGRWVMLGDKNRINYGLTGLWSQSANTYSNSITGTVKASQLRLPTGLRDFSKAILGQRRLK